MVKISVIVPVYNVEKYLRQCLDSVINQTFSDIEIICINDGSTDNSLRILEEYSKKDNRIVLLNQKNSGAGVARNKGVELAKGEYIQFLDSDDYFEPDLLEKMLNKAISFNSDIVVCSYKKVDDLGNITESKNPNSPINLDKTPLGKPFNSDDFKEDIFSLLTPIPWNKLYRRELITKNNIKFPDINICEDIAFVHSCIAIAENILVFDEELVNYRFNRPGSMATYRTKYTIDVVHSCNALKTFLEKNNLYKKLEIAFMKAFTNHIRWDLVLCNEEERQNFFLEFQKIMPNDWQKFEAAIKKDYIDFEYIKNLIKDKDVLLWGASNFLRKILEKESMTISNIVGIIDKNEAAWGKDFYGYKIFSPNKIEQFEKIYILSMIYNNNEDIYPIIKNEIERFYPNAILLPNIFIN